MHRLPIPVRDRHGDVRAVEAYVRTETVELWLLGRLRGVFDRDELAAWLTTRPDQPLTCDQVTWTVAGGDVCLSVRDWVAPEPLTGRTLRWLASDPA